MWSQVLSNLRSWAAHAGTSAPLPAALTPSASGALARRKRASLGEGCATRIITQRSGVSPARSAWRSPRAPQQWRVGCRLRARTAANSRLSASQLAPVGGGAPVRPKGSGAAATPYLPPGAREHRPAACARLSARPPGSRGAISPTCRLAGARSLAQLARIKRCLTLLAAGPNCRRKPPRAPQQAHFDRSGDGAPCQGRPPPRPFAAARWRAARLSCGHGKLPPSKRGSCFHLFLATGARLALGGGTSLGLASERAAWHEGALGERPTGRPQRVGASCKLQVADCKLQVASCKSQVASRKPLAQQITSLIAPHCQAQGRWRRGRHC